MKPVIQPKTKAVRLIEKFDRQLRDLLTAELNAVRNAKDRFIDRIHPNNDLLIA
jgi:hypothetical protein